MAGNNMRGLRNRKEKEPEETVEGISPWLARMTNLRDKLKLGAHHKMERFTVMMGATITALLVFTFFSFVSHSGDVRQNVSAQAIYTNSFSFSLSDQTMSVEGVFGNEDKTDVMVLLKMGSSENMSTNAENYELFITGEKKELSYEPKVSFSIFGSTGYAVIRFEHDEPIPKEIVDVTIRSNSELADASRPPSNSDSEDGSFSMFDQGKFYVNLGADGVEVIDGLTKSETDPTKLYTVLVAEEKDIEIHEEIETETKELGVLLNRMNEFSNRLTSAGYLPPPTPTFILGDYINDDGEFISANDVAGAYAFDYTESTIRNGYINQVMSDVSEYSQFMKEHKERTEAGNMEVSGREQVERSSVLRLENGSEIEMNTIVTGISPSADVSAKGTVESLESTWRTYIRHKVKLQRDLMLQLLVLDADVQSQRTFYSEHTGDGVATFY